MNIPVIAILFAAVLIIAITAIKSTARRKARKHQQATNDRKTCPSIIDADYTRM